MSTGRSQARLALAVIALLVSVLLGIATGLAPKEALPEIIKSHLELMWPAIAVLTVIGIVVVVWQFRFGDTSGARTAASADLEKRNRSRMIEKVRSFWIKGVLEKSLHYEARLVLGLEEKPDAVSHNPWNLIVQQPDHAPRRLPRSTEISTVFEELGRALLILGAPGSGKTTTLLELARDLLHRAEQDADDAIPVVFNLSSWAAKQSTLADWLVDELNERYDVPRKLAKAWVDDEHILPLLDGLDEVALEHRAACVDAINAFREQHGLVPLAVCCREADYEALTMRLRLPGAVVIQPLTPEQVDDYLRLAGKPLEGVRIALQGDAVLRELLDTPLMLSIVALAYQKHSLPQARALKQGALEERRQRLFATYTDAMFERRGRPAPYEPQQTLRWLSWLARSLTQHGQSVFYLEWMQPSWLPTQAQRRLVTSGAAVATGLVFGLVFGLAFGLVFGPFSGLAFGTVFGLAFGTGFWWKTRKSVSRVETVRWSWSAMRQELQRLLIFGLAYGLILGLVGGLLFGGYAYLRHLILRNMLWRNDLTP